VGNNTGIQLKLGDRIRDRIASIGALTTPVAADWCLLTLVQQRPILALVMKSEHRHELQTNELGKFTEKVGGFLEIHGNRLMIGVCVASLVASGIIFWVKRERSSSEAAWRALSSAFASMDPDDFYDVWKAHPGTATGLCARAQEGERRLRMGVERLFDNLDAGQKELEKARKAFQTVIDDRHTPADVREQALMGLGRTLESLSETGDAVKAYEMLVKEFPGSLFKDDAEQRIELLKQSSGQEFYAWFSKYPRPKPRDKRPLDKIGEGADEESENWLEKIKELESDVDSSGLKRRADHGDAPKLPDDEKSDDEPGQTDPDANSAPDGEPKTESVRDPESKPDPGKKPAPDSKSDES
jgi:hypothetical protein